MAYPAPKYFRRGLLALVAAGGGLLLMKRRPRLSETPPVAPRFEAKSQGWRLLGPGGGGALFSPIARKDYIFVTCDMGPAFASQDGGLTWRFVDLDAPVTQRESAPVGLLALGLGLWESNASLSEWQLLFPSGDRTRIGLHDDHADPEFINAPHPIAFAQGPRGSLSVIAKSDEEVKLFTREIGSDDWVTERVLRYQPTALVSVGEILFAIDPARGIVNLGDDQVTLRSRGTTQLISNGSSTFAITNEAEDDPLAGATELWRSLDGGRTFVRCTSALKAAIGSARVVSIGLPPNRSGYLLASFKTDARFGIVASEDGGTSFSVLVADSDGDRAHNVRDPWIANHFEPSWADAPLGLAASDERVRVATDYGRVLVSHDDGRSWLGTYATRTSDHTVSTTGINTTTAYGVHTDPFDLRRVILSSADIGGFVSEDAGASWEPCEGVPRPWRNTMYWAEFDPQVRGRVLAAVSNTHDLPRPKMWRRKSPLSFRGGIVLSEDGGKTWQHHDKGIPDAAVTHLLVDSTQGKRGQWFASVLGHGIFTSTDGGSSWTNTSEGLGHEPLVWSLSRSADGTLYAVVARRGEGDDATPGAVFASSNSGASWRVLALPQQVTGPTCIIADPTDARRLVLSAWGWHHPERNTRGGIFVSNDRGGTWKRVLARDNFVFSVTPDPWHAKRIYAAGFSGTAWRSDDAGETFLPIRDFRYKNAHRIFSDRINDGYIYITTFGASLWHGRADIDTGAKMLTEEFPRRRTM